MDKRLIIILVIFLLFQSIVYFIPKTSNVSIRSLNYDSVEVDIEVEMQDRLNHIANVCKSINISDNVETFSTQNHFRRDQNTGTIYCFIHKVGSTAWHSVFRNLDQYYRENSGEKFQPMKGLQPSKNDILDPNNFAFMIVRHPLDRLISAFTDRILNHQTPQAKEHLPNILRYKAATKNSTVPTFNQFLSYIADGGYDSHWSPYHQDCSPCQVNYDWIVKFEDENMVTLENLVLKISGMDKYANIETKRRSSTPSSQKRHLYKDVRCATIMKIKKIYDLDFKLFEYSADDYLTSQNIDCK